MQKQDFLLATGLGIEFAVIMLLGLLAGKWLDAKLNSYPLFVLCGSVCGFSLGLYTMVKTARGALNQLRKMQTSAAPETEDKK
jgi:F0F1-type ATP synthase assembly protein I